MGLKTDKKIAVTGATGLLGSYLILNLLSRGYTDITILKRETSSTRMLSEIIGKDGFGTDHITVRDVAFNNPQSLSTALRGIETVFNCAANVSSLWKKDDDRLISSNVEFTSHIVNACLRCGVSQLVHVSSIAAIGNVKDGAACSDETDTIETIAGRSAYSVSKFFSENEVLRGGNSGLKTVIVNPGVILGYDRRETGSSMLIPFISSGTPFYTEGITGYVDVKDVARAMTELSEADIDTNERFILVSANITYEELLIMGAEAVGKNKPRIKAGKGLLKTAGKINDFLSTLIGKQLPLSGQIVSSALSTHSYDGSKITRTIAFRYTPIEETVSRVVHEYIADHDNE